MEPSAPAGTATRRSDHVLQRLSRRTSGGRYIPEIDGLRFVCILLVVLLHVQQLSGVWSTRARIGPPFGFLPPIRLPRGDVLAAAVSRGNVGVYIFFAISGFVLALPFASARLHGERLDLGRYWIRRITRIEPPYLIALTASFAIAPFVASVSHMDLIRHYVAGLFYAHGFAYRAANPLDGPSWSLEIELQFYLLVPVLALVFATARASTRLLRIANAGLAGIAVQTLFHYAFGFDLGTVFGDMLYFMAGFAVADVYVFRWDRAPTRHRAWDVVTLVGWPLLIAMWPSGRAVQVIAPALIALLIAAVFRGPITNRILTNRWLVVVGGMCYSIYLIHLPLLVVLAPIGRALVRPTIQATFLLETVVLVPIVLACSMLFFLVIERPCMDPAWPRRVVCFFRSAMRPAPEMAERTTVAS